MIKYIDNSNARAQLRFVEWQAVLRLAYNRDHMKMAAAFPEYIKICDEWHERYKTYIKRNPKRPKAVALHLIYLNLLNNKIKNLDEFYLRLATEVTQLKIRKPRVRKETLDDNNYANNSSYLTKTDDLKSHNRFVNLVLKVAIEITHTDYTQIQLNKIFDVLVSESKEAQRSEKELVTLKDTFFKKVYAMEKSITRAESLILRNSDTKLSKDAYHLYGLFKLRCEVGDTWTLSQTELAKEKLGTGKPAALKAVDLLIKLKLIKIFEQVSQGSVEPKATVYKRIG